MRRSAVRLFFGCVRASKITTPGRERSAKVISSSSSAMVIGSPPRCASHADTVAGGAALVRREADQRRTGEGVGTLSEAPRKSIPKRRRTPHRARSTPAGGIFPRASSIPVPDHRIRDGHRQADARDFHRRERQVHRLAHRAAQEQHQQRRDQQRHLDAGADRDVQREVHPVSHCHQHRRAVLCRVSYDRYQYQSHKELRKPEALHRLLRNRHQNLCHHPRSDGRNQ